MSPQKNDRILIVRQPWLQLILAGQKTMEIRGAPYRGKYFLGNKKMIYGFVDFGQPIPITTDAQWNGLRHHHLVNAPNPPYKRTFGLPILSVHGMSPTPFHHPRGAVGIVRCR